MEQGHSGTVAGNRPVVGVSEDVISFSRLGDGARALRYGGRKQAGCWGE
jgi:hypothetical protein